jgi:CBS domain-containing protein
MKQTKEFMTTNLLTIKANDSLADAYRLMHTKGIRHLPVTDDRNKIVGILSERDIQRAMTVKKISNFQQELHIDKSVPVEEFMSWPVYCVAESTPILRVAEEMLSQKVSAFLVEDNPGRIKGIITTDDLLKLLIGFIRSDKEDALKAISNYFTGPELF